MADGTTGDDVSAARDAVVVGGGPAGLAAAIALRLAGARVALVEPRQPPIDKACGEGLMPSALAALETLGVDLSARGRAFRGIRYVSESTIAEADFPDRARGRSVRRTELHAALLARAEELDVELRFGERAEALTPRGIVTQGGEIAARWVIGADGLRSKVRGWAGLAAPERRERRRFGVSRHLALAPPGEHVEVVFGDRAEAYVTAVGEGEVGVALLWSGPARGFDDLLATRFAPELAARFANAERLSDDRGAGPFRTRVRGLHAGNVLLIGDAAGYVDALTGEGMAIAFHEALALSRALVSDDAARYARASARLRRVPEAVTRLALFMERRPALRRRVVAAFAADPALFSRVLGALGCGRTAGSVGGPGVAKFVLRLAFG